MNENKFDILDNRKGRKKTPARFPAFTPKTNADGTVDCEPLLRAQRDFLIALAKKYGNYTNVCQLSGISQSQMSQLIAGKHLMRLDKIWKLEQMLGQRYEQIRYPTFLRRYW